MDPIRRRALTESLPLFLPAIPFGLVLGLAMTESAMPLAIAWSTNTVIFAGASQLAMVTLAATASWATLVATAVVINLRHVMYSAALAPAFAEQPMWFRRLAPMFLIDQVFALCIDRHELSPAEFRRWYATIATLFYGGWHVAVAIGLLVGDAIPAEWRLDVAPAVMFLGIVALGVSSRAGLVAAVVGAMTCLLAIDLPNNLGLLVGAAAGIAAGFAADRPAPIDEGAAS